MKKKKRIVVLFVALLIVGLCAGAAFVADNSEEILLKENQRYLYAYITSIQGNEVTYMEVEETMVTAMLEPETEALEQEDAKVEEEKTMESAPTESNEMPDMENFPGGGEMPDMENFPGGGEMPDMENLPSGGEMPDMSNMPDRDALEQEESNRQELGGRENAQKNGMQFGGMSETVTTYIPVGVTVHTASDVSTTFSRLASGDLVKILVETNDSGADIIEEIWMLQ